eukprot:116816-Chlamydomonas_euryale.AAC.1
MLSPIRRPGRKAFWWGPTTEKPALGRHLGEQAVLPVEQRDGAVRRAAEPVAAGFWEADHYP